MFERYQMGTSSVVDAIVTTYGRLRALVKVADENAAFGVDRVRRNRRKLERVENLDQTITETIAVLSDLEQEVGSPTANELRDTKTHLQWVLTTLRS